MSFADVKLLRSLPNPSTRFSAPPEGPLEVHSPSILPAQTRLTTECELYRACIDTGRTSPSNARVFGNARIVGDPETGNCWAVNPY